MKNEFNILIIEDNEKTFKSLEGGLANTVYKVWRVTTAKEALKLAKENSFMAVISELRVIDMDGIELMKKIKKINFWINIIVLTVPSFIDSAVAALKEGAYAYLMKPVNVEELKIILKRSIESSCLLIQAGKKRHYEDMSILDGLTGVYNHRHFQEKLDWQIEHLRRFPQAFSLFIIDIDDFKKYNDTKGHLEGDRALFDTAQLLAGLVRENDIVFRYGGEEFAIIMPQTARQYVQRIGERLVERVRIQLPVTISAGAATFPDNAQEKDELVRKVDKALYRAKRTGKDKICVYDEKLDK
ncbi:MAG: diguanylate cyclase [Candidatus Omnitrophota bacterium]|nr:diguanylate cyclase [Candidatus Omnitrophota bacterium]